MPYIANKNIIMMSNGKTWAKGSMIGTEEIPIDVRRQMLSEGVIEQIPEKKTRSAKKKAEPLPMPEIEEVEVD